MCGQVEEGVELSALEFSETGEFCKAVRAKDEHESDLPSAQYRARKAAADGGADGTATGAASSAVKREPTVKREVKDDPDEDDEEMDGHGEEDEDEDEDERGGAAFMYERSVAAGGLGAVLDMARNRGMLGAETETSGRMFDQKGAGLHAYEALPEPTDGKRDATFALDHYDEFGRKMTQKQAFRQLS